VVVACAKAVDALNGTSAGIDSRSASTGHRKLKRFIKSPFQYL
jgi:hypothetical protein